MNLYIICVITLLLGINFVRSVSAQNVELEPNNSAATATALTLEEDTVGQLASESDQDWFGFSVTGDTNAHLQFDSPENNPSSSVVYHTVQIRDSSGTLYASMDTGQTTTLYTALPSSGSYFVVVLDGPFSVTSTGQYRIRLTLSSFDSTYELEPNNNAALANPLLLSRITIGQLQSQSDQDWFSFKTNSPGSVSIRFDSPENNSSSSVVYHTIQVRNAAGAVLVSVDTGHDITFQAGITSAGDYFVVVLDGPFSVTATGVYGITVTSNAAPATKVITTKIYTAVEVTWNSTIDNNYVVDWTPTLQPANWLPLSGNISGTGGEISFLDSVRGEPMGFYRVREK